MIRFAVRTDTIARKAGLVLGLLSLGWIGMALAQPMAPLAPNNDDWNIQLGDPHRSGDYKLTVKAEWTDENGVKQKKTITSSTTIQRDPDNPMTADQKRAKVQADLAAEMEKVKNQVNGGAVANVTGVASTINVDPNTASTPGIKVTSIKAKDDTGQEDDIRKPSDAGPGLALLSAEGSITGRNTYGAAPTASSFSIRTNLGTASVTLSGSMTKYELLTALDLELEAVGVESWLDDDREQLILLLDGGLSGVSATTTDDGLSAVTSVLIRD